METKAKGLTVLVIMAICTLMVPVAAQPTPFMVQGYVFYENGDERNNPIVNVLNMNTSQEWQAERNESYNYYQLMLANGTDVNASKILLFNVTSPVVSQSR